MRLGFSSQSHFTEAFRRKVGATPARWRAAGLGHLDAGTCRNLLQA
ncbi:AraC family transcriptional regulator [Cupriavidus sp. UYPR2.512]|nr:helix-turn-helix transcriptional regulator [Cupriavidus necator]